MCTYFMQFSDFLQDYRGQKLSEYVYYIIIILFGAIAWFVGYAQADFLSTFYGWLGGLGLSLLVRLWVTNRKSNIN